MLDTIPYIIYFLGPFLLAIFLGKKLLKAQYTAFFIGLLAFLVAWIVIVVITGSAIRSGVKAGTVMYSVIIAASAGIFEESSRFLVFKIFRGLRENRNWNTGIMYAIGHSGMESIIVGGSLILTVAVITYAPQLLSEEILSEAEAVLETGFFQGVYSAFERLFVGLLIHSCFTCVVLLSFQQKRYFLIAVLWHFAHDMVAFNLHYVSDHWVTEKLWVLFIVISYSWVLFRLRKRMTTAAQSVTNY